jgi:hypothetical protein
MSSEIGVCDWLLSLRKIIGSFQRCHLEEVSSRNINDGESNTESSISINPISGS